jgi:hypothetical protein
VPMSVRKTLMDGSWVRRKPNIPTQEHKLYTTMNHPYPKPPLRLSCCLPRTSLLYIEITFRLSPGETANITLPLDQTVLEFFRVVHNQRPHIPVHRIIIILGSHQVPAAKYSWNFRKLGGMFYRYHFSPFLLHHAIPYLFVYVYVYMYI